MYASNHTEIFCKLKYGIYFHMGRHERVKFVYIECGRNFSILNINESKNSKMWENDKKIFDTRLPNMWYQTSILWNINCENVEDFLVMCKIFCYWGRLFDCGRNVNVLIESLPQTYNTMWKVKASLETKTYKTSNISNFTVLSLAVLK